MDVDELLPLGSHKRSAADLSKFEDYMDIFELIHEDQLDTAADLLHKWRSSPNKFSYLSTSLQGVLHRALGRPKLAAKSEELAQSLGRHTRSVSARARHLGNRAYLANQLEMAASYYCAGMFSDPCDMRFPLNLSLIHYRCRLFALAGSMARLAILTGKMFGWPQPLIDKARLRLVAATDKMANDFHKAFLVRFIQKSKAPLRWTANSSSPPNLTAADELVVVYQVEYDLAYIFGVHNEQYAAAVEHFGAAIAVRPEAANTYAERAVCWLHLADWTAAMADAEVAIRLAHTDSLRARARWLQGLGLFGLRRFREARQAFEAAAKLRPDVAI